MLASASRDLSSSSTMSNRRETSTSATPRAMKLLLCLCNAWKADAERSAATRRATRDFKTTIVLLYEYPAQVQTETNPIWLGGEEGLEEAASHVVADAVPLIRHQDLDVAVLPVSLDHDAPTLWGRVDSVQDQVHQHLLDLIFVDGHRTAVTAPRARSTQSRIEPEDLLQLLRPKSASYSMESRCDQIVDEELFSLWVQAIA